MTNYTVSCAFDISGGSLGLALGAIDDNNHLGLIVASVGGAIEVNRYILLNGHRTDLGAVRCERFPALTYLTLQAKVEDRFVSLSIGRGGPAGGRSGDMVSIDSFPEPRMQDGTFGFFAPAGSSADLFWYAVSPES